MVTIISLLLKFRNTNSLLFKNSKDCSSYATTLKIFSEISLMTFDLLPFLFSNLYMNLLRSSPAPHNPLFNRFFTKKPPWNSELLLNCLRKIVSYCNSKYVLTSVKIKQKLKLFLLLLLEVSSVKYKFLFPVIANVPRLQISNFASWLTTTIVHGFSCSNHFSRVCFNCSYD